MQDSKFSCGFKIFVKHVVVIAFVALDNHDGDLHALLLLWL